MFINALAGFVGFMPYANGAISSNGIIECLPSWQMRRLFALGVIKQLAQLASCVGDGLASSLLDGPLGLQFESKSNQIQYLGAVGEKFADLIMAKDSG